MVGNTDVLHLKCDSKGESLINEGQTVGTSTTGLDVVKSHVAKVKNVNDVATSTTGLSQKDFVCEDYLLLGQNIGQETRIVEFKQGNSGYLKKTLRDHVCKYVCGFLNSEEGGSLYVGVEDDGAVKGITLNHKEEDQCRLNIDTAIRTIRPHVFPQSYRVYFIPVFKMKTESYERIGDTKVLKLTVFPQKCSGLYETAKGEAYMRRDGSVQGPMRASEIIEFVNFTRCEQLKRKDEEIQQLKHMLEREKLSRVLRANEQLLQSRTPNTQAPPTESRIRPFSNNSAMGSPSLISTMCTIL